MLIQASGPNLPRKRKGWSIAALLGALLGALIFAGGVLSVVLLTDHDYQFGGVLIALRTLDSESDPISNLIAPPGLDYHDLGRPDANHWTWRWGRRYFRFPH